jgi:hypothetical protein
MALVPGFISGVATFSDSTEYKEFSSLAQQNTTSNGWVTFATFTTDDATDGQWQIQTSFNIGQSDKQKQVGFRLQARDGTSGSWTTIDSLDTLETVGQDDTFTLKSGFGFFTHSNGDGVFQIRVQFGQTDEGGTGRLKNVTVTAFLVEVS